MKPVFDLVLNHVSSESQLVKEHPKWFREGKPKFRDTKDFNYDGEGYEQIVSFWKEFIDLYMDELGFVGVRIDCARALPKQLRHDIFAYIKEKNPAAIIFEEALFSDLTPQKYYEEQGDVGATHITGSAYYRTIEWHGGFQRQSPIGAPGDANNEEYWKRKMVSGGVVNFTGNHDEYSGAMKVIRELAVERMDQDATYKNLYAGKMASAFKGDHKVSSFLNDQNKGHLKALMDDRKYDEISLKFLYHYIQEIVNELDDPRNSEHTATLKRVTNMVKNNMVVNMFAGSGGYYMLSGDEVGCLRTPSVFMHESGVPIHAPKISSEMVDFESFFSDIAFNALLPAEKVEVKQVLSQKVYEYFFTHQLQKSIRKVESSVNIINYLFSKVGWSEAKSGVTWSDKEMKDFEARKVLASSVVEEIGKRLKDIVGINPELVKGIVELLKKEDLLKHWFSEVKSFQDGRSETVDFAAYLLRELEKSLTTVSESVSKMEKMERLLVEAVQTNLSKQQGRLEVLSAKVAVLKALNEEQKHGINAIINLRIREYFTDQLQTSPKLSASGNKDLLDKIEQCKALGLDMDKLGGKLGSVSPSLKTLDTETVTSIKEDLIKILGEEGSAALDSMMKVIAGEPFVKYWFVNAKTQTDYTPEAQWGAPKALSAAIEKEFIKDLNEILNKLPKSERGFWSELFLWHMDEALGCVVVRKNGEGYRSRTDVVVIGYDVENTIQLGEKFFLKDLPSWMQGRGFPNVKPETAPQDYHEAYNASLPENNTVHLYVGRDVEVSDGVKSLKGVKIQHYEPRSALQENLKPTEEIIEIGESTDDSREKGKAVVGVDEGQGKGGFASRFKKQAGSHLEREGSRRAHGEGHSGFGSSK